MSQSEDRLGIPIDPSLSASFPSSFPKPSPVWRANGAPLVLQQAYRASETRGTSKPGGYAEGTRNDALDARSNDAGNDGDDEGDHSAHPPARKRHRISKAKAGFRALGSGELSAIQARIFLGYYDQRVWTEKIKCPRIWNHQGVLRRVIIQGCGVERLNQLILTGLEDDELEEVDDDWDDPWRPDFQLAWSHARNKKWVKKILDAVDVLGQKAGVR